MNQQFKQLYEKLVGYWKQLEKRQKRNLLIVGTFFVLTVALLSWFALRPNYVVVFANQTPASLGVITQKLDELKIPHQDTEDSISVPEQYKVQAHVKIAMAGLPQTGTVGYGVFDKSNLGMTQDEFNVRYKEALESNVQDDIQAFQGVHQAKVNIVMPEKQLFVTQQKSDAKASIVVLLEPGVKLSNDQVIGIQQLVSHSVEGLLPANVSIVDQNGMRLVDDDGQAVADGGSGQQTKQQLIENQVETGVTNKIRDALERLVGLNNVDVVVHADINYDQTNWTEKTITPPIPGSKNGAVVSSQTSSEDTEGTTGTPSPAGTITNDPNPGPVPYPTAANGKNSSSKKGNTTNYDWNRHELQGKSAPYTIKAYTVSILLNDPNLTQAKKDEITKFVSTAIGQSNDGSYATKITVTGGSFQAPANPFSSSNAFYKQPWFMGALAAAVVLLGGGVFFASRRRKMIDDVEMAAPPRREDTPIVVEETENQKMKKQLEKLANYKPEDFVNLLRTWLVEE